MKTRTVWVVCGNRGGVGKTLLSLALVSSLMSVRREVAVLDGDARSPDVLAACLRKIPARGADFRRLRPDRYDDMSVFEYEELVHSLLAIGTDLVINTPDGVDDVLMAWFDSTLRVSEGARYTFRLLYVMDHRGNGLDLLPAMAQRFPLLFPMRNLHFARDSEFVDFNCLHAETFREVYDFPDLRSYEVSKMLRDKYLPAEFVDTVANSMLSRQRVKDWLASADNILLDIMHVDEPNSLAVPLYPPPPSADGGLSLVTSTDGFTPV